MTIKEKIKKVEELCRAIRTLEEEIKKILEEKHDN